MCISFHECGRALVSGWKERSLYILDIHIHLATMKRHASSQMATLCYWLLVCLADIQIVRRYPEGAAEECNLSHCTGPGYEVDYERGEERQRERQREGEMERGREGEVASGLSCQKDLSRERFWIFFLALSHHSSLLASRLLQKYAALVHPASTRHSHCNI